MHIRATHTALFASLLSIICCTSKNDVICDITEKNDKNEIIYRVICDSVNEHIATYSRSNELFEIKHEFYELNIVDMHYNLSANNTCVDGVSGYKALVDEVPFFSITRNKDCETGKMKETMSGNCIHVIDSVFEKGYSNVHLFLAIPEGFSDSTNLFISCIDCNDDKYPKKIAITNKQNFVKFDTATSKEWRLVLNMHLNSGQHFSCEKIFYW